MAQKVDSAARVRFIWRVSGGGGGGDRSVQQLVLPAAAVVFSIFFGVCGRVRACAGVCKKPGVCRDCSAEELLLVGGMQSQSFGDIVKAPCRHGSVHSFFCSGCSPCHGDLYCQLLFSYGETINCNVAPRRSKTAGKKE